MNAYQKSICKSELRQDEKILWAKPKTLKMIDYYIVSPLIAYFTAFYATHYFLAEKMMWILPYFGKAVPDKNDESSETSPEGVNWAGINDNYLALFNDVSFYTVIVLTLLITLLIAAIWIYCRQFYVLTDKRLIIFKPKIFFVNVDTLLINRIDDAVLRNGFGIGRLGFIKFEDKALYLDYPDAKKLYNRLLDIKMKT